MKQRTVILKYVSAELRGTAYGIYNLVTGIGLFVGNIEFGYLGDAYSVNLAVAYSLLFSLFAIGGMIVLLKDTLVILEL